MSAGSARGTLARLASALGAIGTAIILIVFGPAAADLPASAGSVPDWFTADPERALVTVVAAVAWLCLLWLCLGVLLGVAAAIPGAAGRLSAALARLILPRAMRRLLEVGLGVTLVAGIGPVMAAMPAAAAGSGHPTTGTSTAALPDLSRVAGMEFTIAPAALTADVAASPDQPAAAAPRPALLPDLGRPASATAAPSPTRPGQPTPQTPDLDRAATGGPATGGPSPTVSVPGLGGSVPVVDLHSTASAPPDAAPPQTPETASSGSSEHAAPDPGAPIRLNTARVPASWPDLNRPPTAQPRVAAPSGQAPAGGTAATAPTNPTNPTNPTSRPTRPAGPAPTTPSRDPVVPPAHRGTGVPAAGATTGGDGDGAIVVLRGDSLWTIAARHLGPTATPEQISAEWHRWWDANADVIGHDPNVILPGQRLTPPSGP